MGGAAALGGVVVGGVAAVDGVAALGGALVGGAALFWSIGPFEPEVDGDGGLEAWGALVDVVSVGGFWTTGATIGGAPPSVNTCVNFEPAGG